MNYVFYIFIQLLVFVGFFSIVGLAISIYDFFANGNESAVVFMVLCAVGLLIAATVIAVLIASNEQLRKTLKEEDTFWVYFLPWL